MSFKNKVKSLSEIEKIVQSLKAKGKKIVTTNGVFDILHLGHLLNLESAKKYGDILIVGVNSDKSVKKLNKGPGRPYNKAKDRTLLLSGFACVDYVFIFDDKRPTKSLARIKPHLHFKSEEYKNFCPEAATIKKYGGRVIFAGKKIRSTTDLVNKIINQAAK